VLAVFETGKKSDAAEMPIGMLRLRNKIATRSYCSAQHDK
jgi:hypothetical protein